MKLYKSKPFKKEMSRVGISLPVLSETDTHLICILLGVKVRLSKKHFHKVYEEVREVN